MYNGYYHCRLCNATYKSCGIGSENTMMNYMLQVTNSILKQKNPEPQCPDMISIHFCDDGSKGVADFVGFKKENQIEYIQI